MSINSIFGNSTQPPPTPLKKKKMKGIYLEKMDISGPETPPRQSSKGMRKFSLDKTPTPEKRKVEGIYMEHAPAPSPKKHKAQKPTSCTFNNVNYPLYQIPGGTENDVFLMMKDNQVAYVYKTPKKGFETQFKGALNQYLTLKDKVGVAKVYNEETAHNDGYIIEEYFPKTLDKISYAEDTKPFFVAYGQFLRKVMESGVKNVDVKPNNVGYRIENGTIKLCLFDFDGCTEDETLMRLKQGVENICHGNSTAATLISEEFKDLKSDLAQEMVGYCKTIEPFVVKLPFDL